MVSPAPSSESSFVTRMDDEQHAAATSVEVQDQQGTETFDMGDGDFELWVNGSLFKTHAYLLKKFSGLKLRIELALETGAAKDTSRGIRIQRDDKGVDDFRDMFKVLYASVVDGPFEFGASTLISALRIATVYDHPNLRSFAIKHLEIMSLSAIQRISIAREFGLASWEGPAYIELCERDEALTKEEAGVLGIDAFVHVAKIREGEQRRRGRVIDALAPVEGDDLSTTGTDDELSDHDNMTSNPDRKKPKKKAAKRKPNADNIPPKDTLTAVPEIQGPCFVGVAIPGNKTVLAPRSDSRLAQSFQVPGCKCEVEDGPYSYSGKACLCQISPCVYEALKAMQTKQVAHIADIHALQESIEELYDRTSPAVEAGLTPCPVINPVAEQVVKWLSGIHA